MNWSPFTLRESAEHALLDVPALRAAAERIAVNMMQGGHAQRKSGGHEKFWQYREYQEGDRPQDIDWRQSAKTDHVYVREKELQTPQSYHFWCNRSKSMGFQSERALHSKSQAAQILCLALALLLERGDEQVGFLEETRASRSDAALNKIAARLLAHSDDELPHGKASSNAQIILCGDFLCAPDAVGKSLDRFTARSSGGLLIQVLDPAELELPYSGHVVFEGLGHAQHRIDNVTAIRGEYQARIQAHLTGIQKLCADHGWHYHLHRTDMPLEVSLMDIWDTLEVRV